MASLESVKTLFAIIFIGPYLIAYAWAKSRFRRVSYRLERCANAPKSLPRRRRSLSETDTPNTQTQSPFFKLPPELRNIVYEEVLVSAAPLHVWRAHRRLCSRPCRADLTSAWEDPDFSLHDECQPPMARDGSVQRRSAGNGDGEPLHHARLLGLLRSCRKIYSESIGLLYTRNKLIIDDHHTLLALPRVIPKRHFKSVRSLYFQIRVFRDYRINHSIRFSWHPVCTVLAGMEGLEDLCVALGYHTINVRRTLRITRPLSASTLLILLTPLRDVRAARFRVQVPSRCELDESVLADDQPFAVEVKRELNECRCCSAEGIEGIEGLIPWFDD